MARTAIKSKAKPLVGIIMGSRSDWETMANAAQTLTDLKIAHECRVVSAHRTPDLLFEYSEQAVGRGVKVIIAGAGGAAHLPGMCAAKTRLPVFGVPVQSKALSGRHPGGHTGDRPRRCHQRRIARRRRAGHAGRKTGPQTGRVARRTDTESAG